MGGRLRRRSSRSRWRRRLRSHAQNFSTGFRSGDDAGTGQSVMFLAAMACLLAAVCRKASLSHKTFQGPCRCTGCSAVMAAWSFPVWTTRHHSSAVNLRALWKATVRKPPSDSPPQSGTARARGTCDGYGFCPASRSIPASPRCRHM